MKKIRFILVQYCSKYNTVQGTTGSPTLLLHRFILMDISATHLNGQKLQAELLLIIWHKSKNSTQGSIHDLYDLQPYYSNYLKKATGKVLLCILYPFSYILLCIIYPICPLVWYAVLSNNKYIIDKNIIQILHKVSYNICMYVFERKLFDKNLTHLSWE